MKIKTSELTDSALGWAVAQAMGWTDVQITRYDDPHSPNEVFFRPGPKRLGGKVVCSSGQCWNPSADWAQGGPVIERERISTISDAREIKESWIAENYAGSKKAFGPTPLIAAMRCFVASKLGDGIDVPKELLP